MNTTLKPQSANRKTKIITIFLGMFIILSGGWLLASNPFGAEVIAPAIYVPVCPVLQRHCRLVREEPVGDHPGRHSVPALGWWLRWKS